LKNIYNGMPASDLVGARWCKSSLSSPQGNCVEFTGLPGGRIAMRNSRHPDGPALIFTERQLRDLIDTLKNGDFDHLLTHSDERRQPKPAACRTTPTRT
jgi:Domain of unknown function (DUF397)